MESGTSAPCTSCGAALGADAQWCGQCYAVCGAPVAVATAQFGAPSLMTADRTTRTLPPTVVKSRWRKSDTTFGPMGRIIATLALVIPFIVFVVLSVFTGGMIIGAPVIWGFIIMPWGLRDTWRAGQISSG